MLRILLKPLFVISVAGLLASCAPVYKIGHDLTPPTSKSGLACVSGCQSKLQQCNIDCDRQYRQCGVEAELKAKRTLPELLKEYPLKLEIWLNEQEAYRRELDLYEFRLDLAETHRDLYFASCLKTGKKRSVCSRSYISHPFSGLDRPTFYKPRPIKPTLESETNRIRKATCSNNCACDSRYRTCFSSCGGIVTSKKICIKNCPK